jgi:hypothetical protein
MIAWRMLLLQATRFAFSFAELSTGSNIEANIAMIAMTTSSSMSVNPRPGQMDFLAKFTFPVSAGAAL